MIRATLIRATAYVLACAVAVVACRLKRLPLRSTLGLYLPSRNQALVYSLLFAALVGLEEWSLSSSGLVPAGKWHADELGVLVRVLSMVVVAPVAEELIFRGLLYTRLSKTPLREVGAIAVQAFFFAACHYDRSLHGAESLALLQVLADGLYFGLVRYRTNSTLLTIALHAGGNGLAAIQRIV